MKFNECDGGLQRFSADLQGILVYSVPSKEQAPTAFMIGERPDWRRRNQRRSRSARVPPSSNRSNLALAKLFRSFHLSGPAIGIAVAMAEVTARPHRWG
jgi:hypothetical protein